MVDNNDLKSMVDNTINGNTTQAEIDFHNYTQKKMQEIIYNVNNDKSKKVDGDKS